MAHASVERQQSFVYSGKLLFMYLYKTQHKILGFLNNKAVEHRNPDVGIHINEIIRDISFTKRSTIIRATTALSLKKYVSFRIKTGIDHYYVHLTDAGLHAFANLELVVLNNNARGNLIRDSLLVTTSVALTIASIASLTQSKIDLIQTTKDIKTSHIELLRTNSKIELIEKNINALMDDGLFYRHKYEALIDSLNNHNRPHR